MSYLKSLVKAIVPKKYHPMVQQMFFIGIQMFYIGNQVVCPCCGRHFRRFHPSGIDALCLRCSSVERHRLIWLYLKNRTNFFSDNLKVLHFAPEYIFEKTFRSMPTLSYITADLNPDKAMVEMDIVNIPCEENSFDVILCSHVLEHVIDDGKAMRELFRVLKPGGWTILQSYLDSKRDKTFEDPSVVTPEDRERLFGQYDHVRIYGRDYKDRLEKAGFKVRVDDYVRDLGIDMIKKYGLREDEDIYFCTKPKPKN